MIWKNILCNMIFVKFLKLKENVMNFLKWFIYVYKKKEKKKEKWLISFNVMWEVRISCLRIF